jgi:hypothetical protein
MSDRPIVTVLDDYAGAVMELADWSVVRRSCDVRTLRTHLEGDDLVAALADTTVLVAIRERTALDESLLCRLPVLRLLIATGQNHTLVDLAAAQRIGITTARTPARGRARCLS